jgi:hypothetical protein
MTIHDCNTNSINHPTRGRKKDPIRQYFPCESHVSTCIYCEKKFKTAATLALKGHLAGDGFEKIHKTTACPNVPSHIRKYYILHMKTRKRSKTKKKEECECLNDDSHNQSNNSNIFAIGSKLQLPNSPQLKEVFTDTLNDNNIIPPLLSNNLLFDSKAFDLASRYFFSSTAFNVGIINNNGNNITMHGDISSSDINHNNNVSEDDSNNENEIEIEKAILSSLL